MYIYIYIYVYKSAYIGST